jgi:acyl carrier protein
MYCKNSNGNAYYFVSFFYDESIDLIDSGIMDSFTYGELLYALEDEFGIEIQPTQVEVDVWRSVERISELVDELK